MGNKAVVWIVLPKPIDKNKKQNYFFKRQSHKKCIVVDKKDWVCLFCVPISSARRPLRLSFRRATSHDNPFFWWGINCPPESILGCPTSRISKRNLRQSKKNQRLNERCLANNVALKSLSIISEITNAYHSDWKDGDGKCKLLHMFAMYSWNLRLSAFLAKFRPVVVIRIAISRAGILAISSIWKFNYSQEQYRIKRNFILVELNLGAGGMGAWPMAWLGPAVEECLQAAVWLSLENSQSDVQMHLGVSVNICCENANLQIVLLSDGFAYHCFFPMVLKPTM